MTSTREEFEDGGELKEYLDGEGGHFYVLQFGDDSGLVLQKEPSDDENSFATVVPRDEPTKDSVRSIAEKNEITIKEGYTQQMLSRLLRSG